MSKIIGTWHSPRQRYVGVPEVPLPVFESRKGAIVIWDLSTPLGDRVDYSPNTVVAPVAGYYYVQGLLAAGAKPFDDDPALYGFPLPTRTTHADLIDHVLVALDAYPRTDFSKEPPILLTGFRRAGRDSNGMVVLEWHKADPAFLARKNSSRQGKPLVLDMARAETLKNQHGADWLWGYTSYLVDHGYDEQIAPTLLTWFFRNEGLLAIAESAIKQKAHAGYQAANRYMILRQRKKDK